MSLDGDYHEFKVTPNLQFFVSLEGVCHEFFLLNLYKLPANLEGSSFGQKFLEIGYDNSLSLELGWSF
jgi:hypothetical protein